MKFHSIVVTGVDGTGKSSLINNLANLFPEGNVKIQYMGLKNWETNAAAKCYDLSHYYKYRRFQIIILFREMYHRVYKHKNDRGLVLFDRFTHEQCLQFRKFKSNWKTKIIESVYWVFLYYLFYKPDVIIYLYCDKKQSINRKKDIKSKEDVERLIKNKKILDDYYLPQKNVIKIDTTRTDESQVVDIVKERLMKSKWFSTLMN